MTLVIKLVAPLTSFVKESNNLSNEPLSLATDFCVKVSFFSVAISVVSTTVMALVVAFAMRFEFPLIIAMFFEVLLGAVSYLVINIALHNQILYELLDKVKDKIKR